MFCEWEYQNTVIEFDANTKAQELQRARKMAKANGWKFSKMKKKEAAT